ncbi:MAG: hypothetical protein M3Z25_18045 [Actinomycetota bacterium]|nr:hypothetical protein [Actinomycetota bacterium]
MRRGRQGDSREIVLVYAIIAARIGQLVERDLAGNGWQFRYDGRLLVRGLMARSMAEGLRHPPHPEDVREGLREAAERRAEAMARITEADRDRAGAMLDISAVAVGGREAGLTVTEMAEIARLNRVQLSRLMPGTNRDNQP